MGTYKKLSEKEIKNYVKKISILKVENHEEEEFKQIHIDDDYIPYLISSYGRVFSIHYMHKKDNVTELKSREDKYGYLLILIHYNHKSYGYNVHRLVALHFVENSDSTKKVQVNHKDGNKKHNYYWNLEWVTPKENIDHAWKNNLSHSIGEQNGNNKYKESQIIKVCQMIEKDKGIKEIIEKTNVSYAMISLILRKKNWINISKNFDFSNYSYGKSRMNEIIKICELLEKTDLSVKEISDLCFVKKSKVYDILRRKNYKNISKNYNFNKRLQNSL